MKIIVCVKQVIDPEAPPTTFSIDTEKKTAQFKGAAPVIDPFAEHAVEAALKIKDTTGASVTVLSAGNSLQRDVIKKPLAMGADELILVEDSEISGLDSCSTVSILAAAIRKIGEYDLILCGREASDTNAGQTGPGIAELLGLPCVTLARKIEVNDSGVVIERVTSRGYDIIDSALPSVITVSNEIGEARYPTIKGIMAAKKITPSVWSLAELLDDGQQSEQCLAELLKLYEPIFEGTCEFVEGETPEQTGEILASKLREAKLL